jgi:uncharacterized protein (TIGR02302 family)
MSRSDPRLGQAFRQRVALARAALGFERLWPALWPALGVLAGFLIVSLLGLWSWLPGWLHAIGLAAFAGGLVWALAHARSAMRWPDRASGLGRLEAVNRLPHQPLRSLGDQLSGGQRDAATVLLWRRHQERLQRLLHGLKVGLPRSDLPRRDPWALRAALLLLLVVAVIEAGNMAPQRLVQAFELDRPGRVSAAPVELTLWVTPPTYTGRPPIRLEAERVANGQPLTIRPPMNLPAGSEALAQLHHLAGAAEHFSLTLDDQGPAFATVGEDSAEATLVIDKSGSLRVGSATEELGAWQLEAVPDQAPSIAFAEPPQVTHKGALRSSFAAKDDYGVVSIALLLSRPGDEANAERIELMRPAGGATDVDDAAYLDLTPHPWAGLPVVLHLEAVDGIDQRGQSEPQKLVLPMREFHHPVARAIIEQRRRLADRPDERAEVATALNSLNRVPERYQNDIGVFLTLRSSTLRLMFEHEDSTLADVMAMLWDAALHLEDGNLSLAGRELRELQQALRDALAQGASDEELERLMAELQRAIDEYLSALTRQAQEQAQNGQQMQPIDPNAMQVERQDLQQMLDAMRDMIRTGAREAAQQMLAQLQELLENLQVAQPGQGGQGEQMMSQMQEMIQRQQALLDQTYQMARQQQGQQGQGQQGQMSQGQMGQGQGGQMSQGQMGQGQQGQIGQAATSQEALRRALGELMRSLGDAGMSIPRALGEAELSMRDARDALRQARPGEAVDPEARAIDQLQQGGQAMMQEMQRMLGQGQGQVPGQQFGQSPNNRDPLGRSLYNQGGADLYGARVPTDLDLGHARAIMEELQRRAAQRSRPVEELDYLQRLLRRF